MKIKRLLVEFEVEETDPTNSATTAEFTSGMWNINGPLYSRYLVALHEAWKLLRGDIVKSQGEEK